MTSMNLECEVNEILSEPLQRSGPAHLEGQIEKIFSDVIFACRGCFLFLRSCHDVANSQPILVAKALKSS